MTRNDIKAELSEVLMGFKLVFFSELAKERPDEFKKANAAAIEAELTKGPIQQQYQNYYTRALGLIKNLMPDRYVEFVSSYEPDPKRKEILSSNYTIRDYFTGLFVTRNGVKLFEPFASFSYQIQHQITLIEALLSTFDKRIVSVEAVLQATIFDKELDAAEDLLVKGHLRAAGAVAGVVIESHLGAICSSKGIKLSKKEPTIADYNEALKASGIVDVPVWRFIQRLADIRNMCVHSKKREPTEDEVQDLVIGAKKISAELM